MSSRRAVEIRNDLLRRRVVISRSATSQALRSVLGWMIFAARAVVTG
jgi:hypothetical protein